MIFFSFSPPHIYDKTQSKFESVENSYPFDHKPELRFTTPIVGMCRNAQKTTVPCYYTRVPRCAMSGFFVHHHLHTFTNCAYKKSFVFSKPKIDARP
jgi:hypothetical protein